MRRHQVREAQETAAGLPHPYEKIQETMGKGGEAKETPHRGAHPLFQFLRQPPHGGRAAPWGR